MRVAPAILALALTLHVAAAARFAVQPPVVARFAAEVLPPTAMLPEDK